MALLYEKFWLGQSVEHRPWKKYEERLHWLSSNAGTEARRALFRRLVDVMQVDEVATWRRLPQQILKHLHWLCASELLECGTDFAEFVPRTLLGWEAPECSSKLILTHQNMKQFNTGNCG